MSKKNSATDEITQHVGIITEVRGNGAKAICDVEVLRDLSSMDNEEVDFSPGQIGTILKIKVSKGVLFVTVRTISTNMVNGKPSDSVTMDLIFWVMVLSPPIPKAV
ncbi:MAG: hypothetical protein P8H03_12300 [Emcibacteraceae bacterium]|nr:hypothetical protein [Emcibacteraceae bacterium]